MYGLETKFILAGLVLAGKILVFAFVVQILRGLWWLLNLLYIQPPSDPLRLLPGPDAPKMKNHFRELMDPDHSPGTHEQWSKTYGKTFRFHGFGSFDYRLISLDWRVISHVLNSTIYVKPWQTRRMLTKLVGQGVFAMEGEVHRMQRRLMTPAFTSQSLKALTPIMFQKAEELKDRWDTIIASFPKDSLPEDTDEKKIKSDNATIDVSHWFARAAFDVMGLAGFDYAFRALEDESEEMYTAYRDMFHVVNKGPGLKKIAEIYFPILEKLLPDESNRKTNQCLETIHRVGKQIVANKKAAIMAGITESKEIQDKDLLSLLIKSNLSENPNQRLSDDELLDQVSTLLFAGYDTTSLALSWTLHYLSIHPEVQCRLREEVLAYSSYGYPSSDPSAAIDALPYLDAVIRESLRLTPPVHGTIRVADEDDAIPLSEPIVLRTNELVHEIRIRKGSYVHIPIEGLNYSKDVWGDDAMEFKPERWFSLPPSAKHPGLANLMNFSFGPHACIGWRFSILEIKIFMTTLLPYFIFEPTAEIGKYNAIVTRPFVKGKHGLGPALPLKVSRFT